MCEYIVGLHNGQPVYDESWRSAGVQETGLEYGDPNAHNDFTDAAAEAVALQIAKASAGIGRTGLVGVTDALL